MKIICSNSVLNVLGRLFLEATAMRGATPKEYNECVSAIKSLNTSILTMYANKPLSWARINATIICPNRYWFKYRRFENAIFVDEVYDTTTGKIIVESIRCITQSDIRLMVEAAVREVLNRQMLNKDFASNTSYEVIDGDRIDMRHESLAEKGWFNDIRMYYSDDMTYCLLRRCDNGNYFYAKIVPAPELGEDETKFEAVPYKSVPLSIRQDSQSLLRKDGIQRSGILVH